MKSLYLLFLKQNVIWELFYKISYDMKKRIIYIME